MLHLSRPLAALVGLGALGVAVVGVGAGATFTDAVNATQSITAGTMNMTVIGPAGSTTDGKTVTLAALPATGSTFTTGPQKVITTNSGNVTANALTLSASDVNNNATLKGELFVEIDSWSGPNETGTLTVAYNGPLSGLEGSPLSIAGPITPGQTDPFNVTFYAGTNGANADGASGSNLDNSPSLSSAAQGGTVIPTITVTYTG